MPIGEFGDIGQAGKGSSGMSADGISHKVRRIAILVTSLDASAGRQLLMAMPTELARQVRRAMTQLTKIDPEEQRQILAEFRMQALVSSDSAPVPTSAQPASHELASTVGHAHTSNAAFVPAQDSNTWASNPANTSPDHRPYATSSRESARPWQHLNVDTLGELLRGERATVVAVVLSQLDPAHAANLLGKLPKPLQREVIVSLSRLGQIDPDAMAAIDEHLASRIATIIIARPARPSRVVGCKNCWLQPHQTCAAIGRPRWHKRKLSWRVA